MKKWLLFAIIGGGLAAIFSFLVVTFLPIFPPAEKYEAYVNPIMVEGDMGVETHVELKNTGSEPLTNVTVYYGGTARPDKIPELDPGERIFLSPPQGADYKEVRVTADNGIDITKPYITPASAPFFGNSGFGG